MQVVLRDKFRLCDKESFGAEGLGGKEGAERDLDAARTTIRSEELRAADEKEQESSSQQGGVPFHNPPRSLPASSNSNFKTWKQRRSGTEWWEATPPE